MNSFLIIFDNGNSFATSFNGNLSQAKKYYLNQIFELNEDEMSRCVDVKEIN